MTYRDLFRRLEETPFKRFRIRVVNNTVYDSFDAGMVIVAKSSAFVVTQYERDEDGRRVAADWRTISISHILEFADIDDKEIRRRKRA
jgi:YD repeat-containing protein